MFLSAFFFSFSDKTDKLTEIDNRGSVFLWIVLYIYTWHDKMDFFICHFFQLVF